MRQGWRFGVAAALAFLSGAAAEAGLAAPVRVATDSGVLVGSEAAGARVFKGIPYAAPPTGDLRWAPPAPVKPWTAERAADAFSPICPQRVHADGSPNEGGASGSFSEDCLYLNVWAPPSAPAGPKGAPVMVWIHGGGNVVGAGSLGAYDGSAFARDGVILVTLNYRLGVLGFFAHPALTKAAGPGEPLASYGLMDQIAALQWVKRNIAAFGGDPSNVTLFGESAGGADTLALMATPMARGLFAKAIVESGGGWSRPVTLAAAEARGDVMAKQVGAPADATVAQLRAIPVLALVISVPANADFGPVVDGRLMTASTTQSFAAAAAAPMPLMIGSNSFEASLMATFKLPPAGVLAMAPPALGAAYADEKTDGARAAALFTDWIMGAPARWIAGRAAAGPAWLYRFAYVPDGLRASVPGAGHDSEIPFVFDSWGHLGALAPTVKLTDRDRAVTALVHSCWVSFAKTGAPVCAGAPAWPPYTRSADTLMNFDAGATPKSRFNAARYDALEAAMLPTLDLGK